MANVKITELTALTDPASTDVLPIVDVVADVTKKVSIADLLENAGSGTAAAPGIAFDGDSNTGIYRPGADQLAISTSGTQRLLIEADGDINIDSGGVFYDATNNRLAIGTTGPGAKLHVIGGSTSGGIDTAAMFTGGTISTAGSGSRIYLSSAQGSETTRSAYIEAVNETGGNDHSLRFATNAPFSSPQERVRIDTSGRLLVGTSSSQTIGNSAAQLQLSTDSATGYAFSLTRAVTDIYGPQINFRSTRGTAASPVIVNDDDQLGSIAFYGYDGSDSNNQFASITALVDGSPGSNDCPGRLVFSTTADSASSPTERMRIQSSGWQWLYSTNSNIAAFSGASAGTSEYFLSGFYGATGQNTGTVSLRIWNNGNIQNTNNSYGALSDIKLKENIVDANSQWDDLKALQVRKYNFKEGQTHTQIGLIAQEVELVSPGLVSISPDLDEDGNDLGTVTKSVNYSVLYMKAVKALQEAMERIEVLEQRLTDAGIA